jgi:hypothetical protein
LLPPHITRARITVSSASTQRVLVPPPSIPRYKAIALVLTQGGLEKKAEGNYGEVTTSQKKAAQRYCYEPVSLTRISSGSRSLISAGSRS